MSWLDFCQLSRLRQLDEVSTGSGSDQVIGLALILRRKKNPVATAPGTDLIAL